MQAAIDGFLYSSEHDRTRNGTVCDIIERAEPDMSCGVEPTFMVRFKDGHLREVLSQQLAPWYAV